jgi:hypothetical protein
MLDPIRLGLDHVAFVEVKPLFRLKT